MDKVPPALQASLTAIVTEAKLACVMLPASAGSMDAMGLQPSLMSLWLLQPSTPVKLSPASISAALNKPPFWCVAWPSSRVLAQMISTGAINVNGKQVADFGCGSGLVAIAAARAGAAAVTAYDLDKTALLACRENARLNKIKLKTKLDLFADAAQDTVQFDLCLVADVFYDPENLPLLSRLLARSKKLIVADCRAHHLQQWGLNKIGEHESCTWPTLDQSDQFRHVSIYASPD